MRDLKIKVDFSSISIQLLVLVLIITIVPITFLTYNNDKILTQDKDDQLKTKINDVSVMVHMVYQDKMAADQATAVQLSQDPRMIYALKNGNKTWIKSIVDEYSKKDKIYYIITVVDSSGIVLARSATDQSGDVTSNARLFLALNGNRSSVTDVLPAQVIIANKLWEQVNATGMTDGLAIINTDPILDEKGHIIGALSISEVLNNNNDIVKTITDPTHAYCTIFQNDTRIATTLMGENGKPIVGTRSLPQIAYDVLHDKKTIEGTYLINNKTLYTHYEPLLNDRKEPVGMLFVGYDAEPGLIQLNQLREQAIITGFIASIFFVAIGYLIIRTITRPIEKIVAIANSIAAGNLDTPVETGASGGEIGELSAAIKQMVSYMVTNIKERINYNESVIKGISDPMLVVGNDGRITFFNEPASSLTGYHASEALGLDYAQVLKVSGEGNGIHGSITKQEVVKGFEDAIMLKNGQKAIVRGSSAPIKDANGIAIGAIILLHDITREKEVDEKIKASLREKEVLLKEIHHRVKNNLQIISSLLSLQSMYIKDKQALGMFRESQHRVKSMALIHEKLYQSKDIARIDFAEYIRNLCGNLIRSYNSSPAMVQLVIDAENISLGIDTAIPCGLIINELVTNSLKYAFADGRKGEVMVSLHSGVDGDKSKYQLIVADNGLGLPEDIEIGKTSTLGLQLVTTLTEQLSGKFEVNRENGTEFIITFSEMKAHERPT